MIKLSEYVTQTEENYLICQKDCTVTVDLTPYTAGDNFLIKEDENLVWFKSIMGKAIFDNFEFDLILDYPVTLFISEMQYDKGNFLKMKYTKGMPILKPTAETESIKQQIPYIERMLGGRELFKDPGHILRKLTSFEPLSKLDTVHLEVLISNCLRDRKDLSKPARLGRTWDPVMINIKEIVFNTSFIQGLEFENVNKALMTGLIQKDTTPSALEKILTGELVK